MESLFLVNMILDLHEVIVRKIVQLLIHDGFLISNDKIA
jgi:hypothetical protein